jgi:hypothetical protein
MFRVYVPAQRTPVHEYGAPPDKDPIQSSVGPVSYPAPATYHVPVASAIPSPLTSVGNKSPTYVYNGQPW